VTDTMVSSAESAVLTAISDRPPATSKRGASVAPPQSATGVGGAGGGAAQAERRSSDVRTIE
jgi:hypothetical protein